MLKIKRYLLSLAMIALMAFLVYQLAEIKSSLSDLENKHLQLETAFNAQKQALTVQAETLKEEMRRDIELAQSKASRELTRMEALLQKKLNSATQIADASAAVKAKMNVHLKQAQHFLENGSYPSAAKQFESALQLANKMPTFDLLKKAEIYEQLALANRVQKKFDLADKYYLQALNFLQEKHQHKPHQQVAEYLGKLARYYLHQEKIEQAETYFQQQIAMWEKLHGLQHRETASSAFRLARMYVKNEKYQQAEPLLQQVWSSASEALAADDPFLVSVNKYRNQVQRALNSEAATTGNSNYETK